MTRVVGAGGGVLPTWATLAAESSRRRTEKTQSDLRIGLMVAPLFPSAFCASAIQIVRPLKSIAETQPKLRALIGEGIVDLRERLQRAVKCRDLDQQPSDNRLGDCDLVKVAPFEFGREVPKMQFLLLVRSDLLRTGEQLLEIRTGADRIPDRVNLQSSDGRCPARRD